MEANAKTEAGRDPRPNVRILRDHDRLEIHVDLTAEADHQFFTGFTQNISAGGLFIATNDHLPIGATFRLAFVLPGADHLFDLECEVRWARQTDMGPGLPAGMGVRFTNITDREESLIDEFISTQETLFYDDEDEL